MAQSEELDGTLTAPGRFLLVSEDKDSGLWPAHTRWLKTMRRLEARSSPKCVSESSFVTSDVEYRPVPVDKHQQIVTVLYIFKYFLFMRKMEALQDQRNLSENIP